MPLEEAEGSIGYLCGLKKQAINGIYIAIQHTIVKKAGAEIESIYSLNKNCYTQTRIIPGQEHLLELENSINTHEKLILF